MQNVKGSFTSYNNIAVIETLEITNEVEIDLNNYCENKLKISNFCQTSVKYT